MPAEEWQERERERDQTTAEEWDVGAGPLVEPSAEETNRRAATDGGEFPAPGAWLTRPPAPAPAPSDEPTEPDELADIPSVRRPLGEWDIDDPWALHDVTNVSGADRTIRLRITGNRAVSDSVLREAAADALGDLNRLPAPRRDEQGRVEPDALASYRRQIRAITDDAAFLMRRHYESLGFYWARTTVEWTFAEADPRLATVTFRVLREEPRVLLDRVDFQGIDAFDPAQLRGLFGTPDAILFGQTYYVEAVVDQARDDLLALYRQAGYLRAEVEVRKPRTEAQWHWSAGRSRELPPDLATVVVQVNEGRLYRLADIRLMLPEAPDQAAALPEALRERLAAFVGQPYRRADHGLIVAEVREFYLDRGHVLVEAEIDDENGAAIDDARGHVTLTIRLQPGGVYRIGEIHFESDTLSEAFLRGIVPLHPGKVYRISDVRAAYRQILRATVVRAPTIRRHDPVGDTVDLTITVDEIPSVELRPYVGWGSYEQLRGSLSLAENNLFGAARILSFEVGASLKSEWATVTFTDPWSLGGHIPYSISGFYLRRDDPAFTRQEIGLKVSLRHAFSAQFDMSLFYEFIDSRAFNLDDPLIDPNDFQVQLGTLTWRAQFATVADRLSPLAGMVHTLNVRLSARPLGSAVDFARIRLQTVFYVPISQESRLVLAVRYLGEVNLPFGGTSAEDIPVQERIFNGGATSVRSFEQDGLRLFQDPTNAFGGQGRNVATLELRFPLILDAGLDAALFADAGNLAATLPSFFNHWSFAVGFGFRYVTPVGPARFDVAWSPTTRHDEERWRIHFWIGYPF